MSKINCNIIQDLLPSFIDDICSKDTKMAVEEHLLSCEACSEYKERMTKSDITLNLKENKALDYMKKIRRSTSLRFIIFFLFIIGSAVWYISKVRSSEYVNILLPILLIGNYLMFWRPSSSQNIGTNKKMGAITGVNLLLILYMPFLSIVLFGHWLDTSSYPFGLEMSNIGPFMDNQLKVIMSIQIMIWIIIGIVYIEKSRFYSVLSGMSITGFCIGLNFACMLRELDSIESYFRRANRQGTIIIIEGIVIIVGYVLLSKIYKGKYREIC